MKTTKYLTEITVKDSKGDEVTLEIHEVVGMGHVFAVDWSYMDQVSDEIYNPYTGSPVRTGNPPDYFKRYNVRDAKGRFAKKPVDVMQINDEGICSPGEHSFIDADNEGEYGYEVCRFCGEKRKK